MSQSPRQFAIEVMSGQRRGLTATVCRGIAAAAAVPYSLVVRSRNALFDCGLRAPRSLGRPVVSVGNLTTGGTGKTPTVAWLATTFARRGRRVAVLLRGYGTRDPQQSDEARELRLRFSRLSSTGHSINVVANPDRVAAARASLLRDTDTDVFVLDDGFQHRRAARDFDLVLVDATNPFGFGRILPRGLLREPIASLRRAHAVLLTRCDLVEPIELQRITALIRSVHADLPVWRSVHAFEQLDDGRNLGALAGLPVGAFCGIGNPEAFRRMLDRSGLEVRAFEAFPDHHDYAPSDLQRLAERRRSLGLELWLTTMKDLARLGDNAERLPARALTLTLRFEGDDEAALLDSIDARIDWGRAEKRLHGGG